MPTATVTVRELHNAETGLDLAVPSFLETKGLLGSTVEYSVVVVSRLSVFKSPRHKESDVVQFSVIKKLSDFEELYKKLNEKFSGTMLPPLPKRALFVDDTVTRERRATLDKLMKFLAATPKISTSPPLLEFLGVRALRASKQQSELEEGSAQKQGEETEATSPEAEGPSLFDEDEKDEEADDLFGEKGEAEGDDTSLFSEASSKARASAADSVQLFESQELEGAMTEEDEKTAQMLVPDAIIQTRVSSAVPSQAQAGADDLFQLDDDLDRLMTVPLGKKSVEEEGAAEGSATHPSPSKPTPAPRPRLPAKPASSGEEPIKGDKPRVPPRSGKLGGKPPVPTKPKPKAEEPPKGGNPEPGLDAGDILQYIAENSTGNDDVDLFS